MTTFFKITTCALGLLAMAMIVWCAFLIDARANRTEKYAKECFRLQQEKLS